LRGAAEVAFFRHGDEVAELSDEHFTSLALAVGRMWAAILAPK
jgi:hypothetical protein